MGLRFSFGLSVYEMKGVYTVFPVGASVFRSLLIFVLVPRLFVKGQENSTTDWENDPFYFGPMFDTKTLIEFKLRLIDGAAANIAKGVSEFRKDMSLIVIKSRRKKYILTKLDWVTWKMQLTTYNQFPNLTALLIHFHSKRHEAHLFLWDEFQSSTVHDCFSLDTGIFSSV